MKMLKRIICVGNRFIKEDAAGPLVYDHLKNKPLPSDVELIDGGLAGLNMLRFIPGADRVIFVDATDGFESSSPVFIVDIDDASPYADAIYDHSAGLAYLLLVLPHVHEGKLPEIYLVGIEGVADPPKIAEAAALSIRVAQRGINSGEHK